MTVDEFLVWCETAPGRHELVRGEVVAMAPERVRHAEAKLAVVDALRHGLRAAGVPCRAMPDGMTVRIDSHTAFEPDALVYCGPRLDPDAVEVPAPVVVEVLSPGTRRTDTGIKLAAYVRLPSVAHDLVMDAQERLVLHHRRGAEAIETRIAREGRLHLDPPGFAVAVEDLFPEP
ncbi:MAG: Uma2 family endonuclease [Methylobacterium sp.]|nr:Uma2 family endonuclease [Methylobacterium sp.]